MDIYDLYKPLRNHIRAYALLDSLEVIWAYFQYLQFRMPFPQGIEVPASVISTDKAKQGVFEWELEVLVREVILHAGSCGSRSMRRSADFAAAVNKLKYLEGAISERYYSQNEPHQVELNRIAHRQLPWQSRPSTRALVRYCKIFGHPDVSPMVEQALGLPVIDLYRTGMAFIGMYMKQFALTPPLASTIPGLESIRLQEFTRRLMVDMATIRSHVHDAQSYNEDFVHTLNPLLRTPLVTVERGGRPAIVAPIPSYIFRRFTDGVYYDVCGSSGFDSAFGSAFQSYVGEVLRAIAAKQPGITVLSEERYRVGKQEKRSIDWILSDPTGSIFVECKAKRLRYAAKLSLGPTGVLSEELRTLAVAVVQCYKALADARAGLYPHWRSGNVVYLLVVTMEDWLAFGTHIVSTLKELVEDLMRTAGMELEIIDKVPFSICSVAELEIGAQVAANVGLARFAATCTSGGRNVWSQQSVLYNDFAEVTAASHPSLFEGDAEQIFLRRK